MTKKVARLLLSLLDLLPDTLQLVSSKFTYIPINYIYWQSSSSTTSHITRATRSNNQFVSFIVYN